MKKSSKKKNILIGSLGLTIGAILTIIFSPLGNIYYFELINIILAALSMKEVAAIIECNRVIEKEEPQSVALEENKFIAKILTPKRPTLLATLKALRSELTPFQSNREVLPSFEKETPPAEYALKK